MWAVISKSNNIVAKDFPSKIAAIQYIKYYANNCRTINQNSKEYIMIDMKRK